MSVEREVLIYDWDHEGSERLKAANFRLLDTTLRDGVQTPGIKQPSLEDKLRIIDYDVSLGIEAIDICLPADPATRYFQEGVKSAIYIKEKYPQTEIVVLARTIESDVTSTLQFAQQAGAKISVILFRGSSDLRLLAEDWREEEIVRDMQRFTKQIVKEGLDVICATEDTTRSRPEFLREIFEAGKSEGAREFCLADTVGYASPMGIIKQVRWLKKEVIGESDLQIQFHGHDDDGVATANSLAAIQAGVKTIHVTHLGIGERAGNTAVEEILVNLARRGIDKYDLSGLVKGANMVADAFGIRIPKNHPLIGEDVFTTESGIHAAGVDKARLKGLDGEGRVVYSPVDSRLVGRENEVKIGPLGGKHSVDWVLDKMGISSSQKLISALLLQARIKNSALTEEEIRAVTREVNGG